MKQADVEKEIRAAFTASGFRDEQFVVGRCFMLKLVVGEDLHQIEVSRNPTRRQLDEVIGKISALGERQEKYRSDYSSRQKSLGLSGLCVEEQ